MYYWVFDMLEIPGQLNATEEVVATAAIFLFVFMVVSIADLIYKFFSSFWP